MPSDLTNTHAPESVWDYPRPPRLEPTSLELLVRHGGELIASTRRGFRILETSHPPVYYFPAPDVRLDLLAPSTRRSTFCEFKGLARYWTLAPAARGRAQAAAPDIAWSYPEPAAPYRALKDYLAFYAGRVDECFVDGERVKPQAGDFYGGWVTSWIQGPFKGAPGTLGW